MTRGGRKDDDNVGSTTAENNDDDTHSADIDWQCKSNSAAAARSGRSGRARHPVYSNGTFYYIIIIF